MSKPTVQDLKDAAEYATRKILSEIVLGEKYPVVVESYTTEFDEKRHDDSFKQIPVYKFTKSACEYLSCFDKGDPKDGSVPCSKYEKGSTLTVGGFNYPNCQEGCEFCDTVSGLNSPGVFKERKHKAGTEAVWRDGKCVIPNTPLKNYCIFSKNRSDRFLPGVTDVPPFQLTSDYKCKITKNYCDYYGLKFANGDCVYTKTQAFLEDYVFGKTLTRMLLPVGDIPNYIFGHDTQYADSRSVESIVAELSVYVSPAVAKKIATTLASKLSGSKAVVEILENDGAYVLENSLKALVISQVAKSALEGVALFITEAVDPALNVLLVLQIVGLVLDASVKLFHVNDRWFGQQELDKIQEQYEKYYDRLEDKELTPEKMASFCMRGNDDALEKTLLYISRYIKSLKINSVGQVLEWTASEKGEFDPKGYLSLYDLMSETDVNAAVRSPNEALRKEKEESLERTKRATPPLFSIPACLAFLALYEFTRRSFFLFLFLVTVLCLCFLLVFDRRVSLLSQPSFSV